LSLISELKRRNVVRVAGLYLVGAWLLVQVAATLLPVFEAPAWVMKVLVGLVAAGFVAALMFSWVFELTPDGLKRDADGEVARPVAVADARRMDRLLLVGMALALGYFALDKFVLAPARGVATARDARTASPSANPPAGTVAGTNDAAQASDPKSIAVLAFEDLSAGKDNGYFADGVAEEILNALARVRQLKVAGRTSSFYYKGRNEPLAAIGTALGVAHVLDGSVRKQGQRLRISAQLIRVGDGFPLWSDTFDGTDADIFALQENIARQVTGALQVALNVGQQDRLVEVGTTSADAYALYLRATDVFNRRDFTHYERALADAGKAVELDPGFARAHSRLATLYYAAAGQWDPSRYDELGAKSTEHARRALSLNPKLAEPHAVLGVLAQGARRYGEMRAELDTAVALDPTDPTALLWDAFTRCITGYIVPCTLALDRLLTIDPLLPNALGWRSRLLVSGGDLDAAERMIARAEEVGLRWNANQQMYLAFARDDRITARRLAEETFGMFAAGLPADAPSAFAGAIVGDAEASARTLQIIEEHLAAHPAHANSLVPLVLVQMGAIDRGLEVFARKHTSNDPMFLGGVLGTRLHAAAWASPAFPRFLRDTGIAALWDQIGPPEHCSKDAAGDYRCK